MMVEWLTMYMVQIPPKYDDVICEQSLRRSVRSLSLQSILIDTSAISNPYVFKTTFIPTRNKFKLQIFGQCWVEIKCFQVITLIIIISLILDQFGIKRGSQNFSPGSSFRSTQWHFEFLCWKVPQNELVNSLLTSEIHNEVCCLIWCYPMPLRPLDILQWFSYYTPCCVSSTLGFCNLPVIFPFFIMIKLFRTQLWRKIALWNEENETF